MAAPVVRGIELPCNETRRKRLNDMMLTDSRTTLMHTCAARLVIGHPCPNRAARCHEAARVPARA